MATSAVENEIGISLEPLLRSTGVYGKRKKRFKTIRLKGLDNDGKSYSEDREPEKTPVLAIFPYSEEPPRFMLGLPDSNTVKLEFLVFFNPAFLGPHKSPGSFRNANAEQFARLVSKIAHAQAVASLGLGTFKPLLCDLIRGTKTSDWPQWVGLCPETPEPIPGAPHTSVQIYKQPNNILLGRVRFFESIGGPIYDVVIGPLSSDASASFVQP